MIEVGTKAPGFSLVDQFSRTITLDQFRRAENFCAYRPHPVRLPLDPSFDDAVFSRLDREAVAPWPQF